MSINVKQLIRVLDTDVKGSLPLNIALTKVQGVSFMLANAIVKVLNMENKKAGELSQQELNKIRDVVNNPSKYKIPAWLLNRRKDPEEGKDNHLITSNLKLRKEFDIKILKKIKSYRGMRHAAGLPVRGQGTKSHFRHGRSVGVLKKTAKGKT